MKCLNCASSDTQVNRSLVPRLATVPKYLEDLSQRTGRYGSALPAVPGCALKMPRFRGGGHLLVFNKCSQVVKGRGSNRDCMCSESGTGVCVVLPRLV